ncbi:LysE family translocator [Vibrio aestuarianus subsp. cardii]|uniref:LysE family translocator n=1 Tax=Vibrio aestuarianus TaxID=28171 RepID=UPI001558731C|nr:LysE family translocator [Vibrio aestuarianus]NGZ67822.1 LysE family translocator [Vibrio aestuarianus subsp. cardii]
MTLETWIVYAFAILILTASSGPSSLLCMTKGVTHGMRGALFTALGSLTAITIILSLSFTGLGVLIASSELIFNVVKWIGAAYLIYLGINALLSKSQTLSVKPNESKGGTARSHYISGFVVGASNPKAIIFFSALFPQFISPDVSLMSQYLIFAATFVVFELSWLLTYAYLGTKSSNWLLAESRVNIFNKLTGGVFIGAGAILSSTSRV